MLRTRTVYLDPGYLEEIAHFVSNRKLLCRRTDVVQAAQHRLPDADLGPRLSMGSNTSSHMDCGTVSLLLNAKGHPNDRTLTFYITGFLGGEPLAFSEGQYIPFLSSFPCTSPPTPWLLQYCFDRYLLRFSHTTAEPRRPQL